MPEESIKWVTTEVIRAVTEIEVQRGRTAVSMDGDVIPLEDLDGFDSLNCMEAAVLLSRRLGVTVDHRGFASSRGQPLSCAQIAHIILAQHGSALTPPVESSA